MKTMMMVVIASLVSMSASAEIMIGPKGERTQLTYKIDGISGVGRIATYYKPMASADAGETHALFYDLTTARTFCEEIGYEFLNRKYGKNTEQMPVIGIHDNGAVWSSKDMKDAIVLTEVTCGPPLK